jgi:hypothetical protein
LSARPIPQRVLDRARQRIVAGDNDCAISTYSVGSHGYAQIGWTEGGKSHMRLAHRVVWEAEHGEIPEGMTVDHLCKTRKCVNVDHLRLLTNFENARRTSGRDWPLGECVNGHPNSALRLHGAKSVCGSCSADWQRQYRARKAAVA